MDSPFGLFSPKKLISKGFELLGLGDFERDMQGLQDTLFGTTYGQERLNRQTLESNAAQAQISRDWQELMYNRYESPQALMQQFRDAGLNPALMYGSSSPSPSFADSPASIGAGSAAHGNFSISDFLVGSQMANLDADTSLKEAHSKSILDKLPKELKVLDATEESISSGVKLNNQLVEQSKAYTKVLGEDFQQKFIENEFLSQTLDSRIKIVKAENRIKSSEATYIVDNLKAQLSNLHESTRLMRSHRFLNSQLGAHYAALDRHLSYVNQNLEEMTDFIKKRKNNIPLENTMGFINSASGALNSASNLIGTILSRGQKPTVNVGAGPNQWDATSPDYGF